MLASADPLSVSQRVVRASARLASLAAASLLLAAAPVVAQDWGDDAEDDWRAPPQRQAAPRSASPAISNPGGAATGWSVRTGLGFTADPSTFLVHFEAPYALERWIAVGPVLQLGLNDNRTIVAPTANVTLRVPNLPGRSFDRVHPYGFAGIGFAYVEKDGGRNDGDGAGFLIDSGVGIEYQVSNRVFLGTQMTFNFLPKEVQDENFIFAWQIGGIRFEF